tara:strand:- start:52 stop:201 length:150 start_codon:yes stop_codon:yes gene_type:complete
MKHISEIIKNIFQKGLNQNEKLIKNIKQYEQKEKIKQQESKVLGKRTIK